MKKKDLFTKLIIAGLLLLNVCQSVVLIHLLKNRNSIDFNTSVEYFRYYDDNITDMKTDVTAVFIGNSITALWKAEDPVFFQKNNYISRGIGGQTSTHLLLRFRQDVINIKPKVVVINAGINDIAEALGTYYPGMTMDNIKSMVQLAQVNNIDVVLTSVTPSGNFSWKPFVWNVSRKIDTLNDSIKQYAADNNIIYVDYNSALRDKDGTFNKQYTFDDVHPNKAGFVVMKNLIQLSLRSIPDDEL